MAGKRPPAGSIVHCELYSEDPAATQRFYEKVFGWRFDQVPNADYWIVKAPSRPHGGLLKRQKPKTPGGFTPPSTLNYILVDSVDEAAKKITAAGGKILVPKYEVPGMGWFSVFEAPGGIVHNVVQPGANMTWIE